MPNQTQPGKLKRKPANGAGATPKQETLMSLKMEATEVLGLTEKVRQVGWGGLTAKETGSIGGLMNRIQREKNRDLQNGKMGDGSVLGTVND